MQGSKNVTGRPSKHPQLLNGLKQYLDEARSNPSLKLTVLAISRTIGVKKSTIYRHQQYNPEVAELLRSIRTLAVARKLAKLDTEEFIDSGSDESGKIFQETSLDSVHDVAGSISLELLTTRAARAVQIAVWSMGRFVGRHRKHRYVSDLPRVVFDLDTTLAQLHRIREDLGSLSDEWIQISQNDCEIAGAGDQLSLSYISEK